MQESTAQLVLARVRNVTTDTSGHKRKKRKGEDGNRSRSGLHARRDLNPGAVLSNTRRRGKENTHTYTQTHKAHRCSSTGRSS